MRTHERLKRWRQKGGIRQVDAGKLTGIDQATWSRIEAGKQMPSIVQASSIEMVTGGAVRISDWLPRRRQKRSPAAVAA
jgi:transcriptional regulator with XRE-family HTH domain